MMGGAALSGATSAWLWNSQGSYLTKCASKSNSGLYNGINWVGNMFTYVSGNLAAAYLI